MKTILLVLALILPGTVFAGPAETVQDTVTKLIQILQIGNAGQRAASMCALVKSRVDVANIGSTLIGGRVFTAADPQGAQKFMALVPSIIVSEFFDRLGNVGDAPVSVEPTLIPKGSSFVGVNTHIDHTIYVVTVNRANNRVYDVQWTSVSLVNSKRAQYISQLQRYQAAGQKPLTALVNSLINSGNMVNCN